MESYRYVAGETKIGNVPTALERAGDFSQSLNNVGKHITVKDPFNKNSAFPGDVIPVKRFSPVALSLLNYYPLPNRRNHQNDFQATSNNISGWDSFIAKGDHKFSVGDTLSVEYGKRFGRNNAAWAGSNLGEFPNWILTGSQAALTSTPAEARKCAHAWNRVSIGFFSAWETVRRLIWTQV